MTKGLTVSPTSISPSHASTAHTSSTHGLGADSTNVITIRKARLSDARSIFDLYLKVTHDNPGQLLREENEVTLDYIHVELHKGFHRGLVMVVELDQTIIGYFNAYTPKSSCLAHVLTQASMMIDPAWQAQGLGRLLLEQYLEEICSTMPHVYRFELLPHQSNQRAIAFYTQHGFQQEGEAINKIRTTDGKFESEVTLVWFNPNFSEQQLRAYHGELDCQL